MNAPSWSEPGFAALADLVRDCTGLVFPPARRDDVEAGARKVMARIGAGDLPSFLQRVRAEAPLLDDLIAELTVGETYFFREPRHFDFIREYIIPELRHLRGAEHALRIWSAGCASGEEAYSLAILFDELGLAKQAHILATDISRAQLTRAREGAYTSWSLRGEGTRLTGNYLQSTGSHFRLAERIRQRVEFAYLNLAQDVYPTLATNTWGMDVVLCRNVLIYLDVNIVRSVARRLYDSLAPGGFLVAGPSDPPLADHAPFETLMSPAGMIYRKAYALSCPSVLPPSRALTTPTETVRAPPDPGRTEPPRLTSITVPEPLAPIDPVAEARESLAQGDNRRVVELTRRLIADVSATALCLRALANLGDVEAAVTTAAEAAIRHPASIEIGFLHAVFLMSLERYADAERVLKRVLYLDRSLAIAQFTLGATLHRLGRLEAAARAYRSARDIAAQRPAHEIVPLADGERAGRLAQAAATRLAILEPQPEYIQ